MGANNHPNVRPDGVDNETKANRLASDLEGVDNVDSVRVEHLKHRDDIRVAIELKSPLRLNAEVMGVVSDHDGDITSGCIENGMNPFRVYL